MAATNPDRTGRISRTTAETTINLALTLDAKGELRGSTGVGFFDHMLTLFARHGRMDIELECKGDLHVDAHHTVEDIGICLGDALSKALGEKRGISRYGFAYVPMDESLARVVIDLSGRCHTVINAEVDTPRVGDFDTELAWEFFQAFARAGKMNLHIDLIRCGNAHHGIEACFKAVATALAQAVMRGTGRDDIPSTKGVL
jgi:imidazoleglycerol-phosphate dehydratase